MSDDLIRQSDAIEAIRKARVSDVISYQYADLFINALYRVPSADRLSGEWIDYRPHNISLFDCSICGYHAKKMSNFCPNCGARMKGADE